MEYKYIKNGTTLKVYQEKCTGCGLCLDVCPHGVFSLEEGVATIKNREACMECGACMLNCPAKAIDVKSGVGCASAIIKGFATGSEPSCDCSSGGCC